METKYKVGERIALGELTLQITVAGDKFGATPHYGFYYEGKGKWEQGWIPCEILDSLGRPA